MATITVNNANDRGSGSLRDALTRAQNGDTIAFASTLANKTITLSSGQLNITKNLTIDGAAAPNLTISGNYSSRVFMVDRLLTNVHLKNLTIANGKTTGDGGGVQVRDHTTLTVTNCGFNNNSGGRGGGIHFDFGGKGVIVNSRFNGNDGTLTKSGNSGGAITTYGGCDIKVNGSRFTNNRGVNGGGIYSLTGGLTVENSVFLGNSTVMEGLGGGAIFTDGAKPGDVPGIGTIAVRNSWFEGNQAKGEGGALFLYGYGNDKIILENSTVLNNTATANNLGFARGGGLRGNADLTVRNVTFANNTATKQGGGLWVDGWAPINVLNSTFSGNKVTDDAGGAMFLNTDLSAPVNIKNSTIVNNSAGRACGAFWMNKPNQPVTIANTIVANNTARDRGQLQVGYQPRDGGGNIEFPPPPWGSRVAAGSRLVDPKLGPLQNVGGVLVHPLLTGSPAINTGATGALPTDERGATRDSRPDVGAYEFGVNAAAPTILSINDVTLTEGNSGTKTAVFTVTRSGSSSRLTSVNYSTANGSAISGQDYNSLSGTLNFLPGQTTQTIRVAIVGDTSLEGGETLFVNLSSVANGAIADGKGVATIQNDDASTTSLTSTNLSTARSPASPDAIPAQSNGSSGGWFTRSLLSPGSNQILGNRSSELASSSAIVQAQAGELGR